MARTNRQGNREVPISIAYPEGEVEEEKKEEANPSRIQSGSTGNSEKRTMPSKQRPYKCPVQRNFGGCPDCYDKPGQHGCNFCCQRSASRPPPRDPSRLPRAASGPVHARSRSSKGKPPVRKETAAPRLVPAPQEHPARGNYSEKWQAPPAAGSKISLDKNAPAQQHSKCCELCFAEIDKKKSKKSAEPFCAPCCDSGQSPLKGPVAGHDSHGSSRNAAQPSEPHLQSTGKPPQKAPFCDYGRHGEQKQPPKNPDRKKLCKACRRKQLDVYGYLPCPVKHPAPKVAADRPFNPNDAKMDYMEYWNRSGRFIRNPLTVAACNCSMQPRGKRPMNLKPPPTSCCPAGAPKRSNYCSRSDMQGPRHSRKPSGYSLPPLNNNNNCTNFVPQAYFGERQPEEERSARKDLLHYSGAYQREPAASEQRGMNTRPSPPKNRLHLTRPHLSTSNRRLSGSGIRRSIHRQYLSRSLPPRVATLRRVPKARSVKTRSSAEKTPQAKLEEGKQLRRTKARCLPAGATKAHCRAKSRLEMLRPNAVGSFRSPSLAQPGPAKKSLPPSAPLPEAARPAIAPPTSPLAEPEKTLGIVSAGGEALEDTRVRFYRGGFLSIRPHFPFESTKASASPSQASSAVADDTGKPDMMLPVTSLASSFAASNNWQMNGFVAANPAFGLHRPPGPPVGTKAAGRLLRKLWPNWLFSGKAKTARA